MKTSKAQIEASKRYIARNERYNIVFPRGTKERIEAVLSFAGKQTVTEYIRSTVLEVLEVDEAFKEFEKSLDI